MAAAFFQALGPYLPAIFQTLGSAAPYLLGNKGGRDSYQTSLLNPAAQQQYERYAQQGPPNLEQNPLHQAGSNWLMNQLQSQYNPDQFNQLFDQGVANPAWKNYNEQVAPSLTSKYYAPSGVYGGALNQALNSSAKDLQGGLNELRARHQFGNEQQHYNRQFGAANQALNYAQAPFQQQQNYYDRLFQPSYQATTETPTPFAASLQNFLSGLPGMINAWPKGGSQSSTPGTPQIANLQTPGYGIFGNQNQGFGQQQYGRLPEASDILGRYITGK